MSVAALTEGSPAVTVHSTPAEASMGPEQVAIPGKTADVIIVGAGISGVGAASRLTTKLPGKSYLIIDARDRVGGTWDLFRYPGIRSDSDLITYGFQYKPWLKERAIADGPDIRSYLDEVVEEYGIAPHLRSGRKVLRADWSSSEATWTLTVHNQRSGEDETYSCRWLVSATGYYDHDKGFRPTFDGEDEFAGRVVHPQDWDESIDYSGQQVVVVGSGATAITMIPAMAGTARRVTMLQRSPSYVLPLPSKDIVFSLLKLVMSDQKAFAVAHRANSQRLRIIVSLSKRFPKAVRRVVRSINKALLPKDFDVDTHFNPRYNPWDQRMCFVPDGDLFKAIKAGDADVVTDEIDRFVREGVLLRSGKVLAADLIITATGLNMLAFGGMDVWVDGNPVTWSDTVTFKSMMLSGLPNFAYLFGYTNQSWTLKVDLATEHWCRLLAYMDEHSFDTVIPNFDDPAMERQPLMDDLNSGYVTRGIGAFPRQGASGPWTAKMHLGIDAERLQRGAVEDPALAFSRLDRTAEEAGRRPRKRTAGSPLDAQRA